MPSIGPRRLAGIASKGEMKTVIVTAALTIEQGKLLVTQRKKDSSYGLLWEFPGGKVEEGEDPRGALRREIREELDIEVEVGGLFDAVFYFYTAHPILLLVYRCWVQRGSLKPIGCHAFRWVTPGELGELAMPPADEPVRKHLGSFDRDVPRSGKAR
jgi:8-oxo-dGTP diphosphatase